MMIGSAVVARHDVERDRAEERATGSTPELRKAVAALLVAAARRVNAVNEIAPTEATAETCHSQRYPSPHTVTICTGLEGSSSTFMRSRRMFTSTIFSSPT